MKKAILLAAMAAVTALAGCNKDAGKYYYWPPEGELTLYNQEKTAAAYIDYDNGATIYLLEGEPAAYLVSEYGEKSTDVVTLVHGFNGEFLGWFDDGVMWDKDGNAVGAKKGAVRGTIINMTSVIERPKGARHAKPSKNAKSALTAKPASWSDKWSETSLTDFLKKGMKEE